MREFFFSISMRKTKQNLLDQKFLLFFLTLHSSQTEAYIASIWTHLQMNFCHPSLGSKVLVERLPGIKHYSGMNLRADVASLISMYTNTENLNGADLMLYMGYDWIGGGSSAVVGWQT